jgi:hypothetical protein
MRNVTVKYYKTGDMLEKDLHNCARCKVYTRCEWHHVRTRSKGGKRVIPLCSECHRWVGENIKEATKLGLYQGGYEVQPKQ